jgi:hypothetical protein
MTMNSIYPYPQTGLAAKTNIPKEKVSKTFSINPSIINSKIEGGMYYFSFNNNCYSVNMDFYTKIDQDTLKTKLNNWLRESDKKYIKLVSFDTNKSRFVFDIDAWLDDGMKNIKSTKSIIRFQRKYMLKVQPPYIVRTCGQRYDLQKYIASYFKDYCKKHPELRKTVFNIVTDEVEKKMRIGAVNYFDYSYDYQSNCISVSLKPVYEMTVMSAIILMLQKKNETKTMGFDNSVISHLKAFEYMSK